MDRSVLKLHFGLSSITFSVIFNSDPDVLVYIIPSLCSINLSNRLGCYFIITKKTMRADEKSHSPACATLLHDLRPVVARQFAESVITVHYWPFNDLGITQEETGLCK